MKMSRLLRSPLFHIAWIVVLVLIILALRINARLNPGPTIQDSPTTMIGFNHIGINVLDLDKMVAFYQKATDYQLLKRESICNDDNADKVFGQDNLCYEKAILKGPNMLLELTEFANQTDTVIENMPPQGPGMTHTCYQSSMTKAGYDMFKAAGVEMLSRGDEAVDLGGYGVTYAYAYDPEGNMVELEQMSETLIKVQIGEEWAKENPLWMTQVALISHDLSQLTDFYKTVFAIEPFRVGSYKDNPKFDEIANLDNMAFDAAWFGMDSQGKKLELMQYVNPATQPPLGKTGTTDLGYTFSIEVTNIQKEYSRLKPLGIEFVSEPAIVGDFWTVFAHDIDGNIFSLRQTTSTESEYSLKNF